MDGKKDDPASNLTEEVLRRYASVGMSIGALSHALNNILGNISLKANTLLALPSGDMQPAQREGLLTIIEYAKRCSLILRTVREYSQQAGKGGGPIELNAITRQVVEDHAFYLAINNISVGLELCKQPLTGSGDESSIKLVLAHLLLNAVEASGPGGLGKVTVATGRDNGMLRVSVEDNGRGMDEAELERAFLPFSSLPKGANSIGLGLSVSRSIAEEHGGTLRLERLSGGGTAAVLRLPAAG